MNPDALVVYHGKPAKVSSITKDKLEIVTADGNRKNVRPKDVEFLHRGPVASLNFVPPGAPDWAELIELMAGETFSFADFTELVYGADTPGNSWAAFEELTSGVRFTGSVATGVTPKSAEELAAALQQQAAKAAEKQQHQELLERIKTAQLLPDDRKSMREIEQVARGEAENSRLLKELSIEATPEKAHSLLLKLGVWPDLFNPWPARFGVDTMAAKLDLPELPAEERVDLTSMRALAIDDAGSNDPDDAIGFADGQLYVHVADPGALIELDSPVEQEAAQRGANCYLPDLISPMLPEAALPQLGLGLQAKSPALTFVLHITEDGEAELDKMFLSTLHVERLTYETCEAQADVAPLPEIREALARFKEKRRTNGALFIKLPEVKTRVVDGEITITPCPVTPVRELVANAMLAAGSAVAKAMVAQSVPFPFVHQAPPELSPEEVGDSMADMFQLRRSCTAGEVLAVPGKHAGLGLEPYTRVTSPLRRYADLLAHLQLRKLLRGETPLDWETMERRLAHSEAAAADRRKLEKYSNEYFLLLYLLRHPEWTGDGVVVDRQGERTTILIPEFAYEYKCRLNGKIELGETAQLHFVAADPARLRLTLGVKLVKE